ncbi:MAG: hypothetical protein KGJ13_12430 [Patescibacteria group bacterium]|nr:hypothetical protein [Patescibacteria group bacterium]
MQCKARSGNKFWLAWGTGENPKTTSYCMIYPIILTWADGHPGRIINPEIVSYLREQVVKRNGMEVTALARVEFTICSSRPATEAEIKAWRAQP